MSSTSAAFTDPRHHSTAFLAGWQAYFASGAAMLVLVLSAITFSASADFLILGTLLSILLGVTCECLWRLRKDAFHADPPSLLEMPIQLAADERVFAEYDRLARSLLGISRHRDPIFRDVALDQLAKLTQQVDQIAGGTLVFEGTETWRIVYESLLRSPGLHLYRSVAWVKDRRYWQDEPGRKSMAVNFELHEASRVTIERIAIIADELWPVGEPLPDERVHIWIREQHQQGIAVKLLRESALAAEPELIADLGIYGFRALGVQELDDECHTVRFTLTFDPAKVKEAEARWQRLSVYATPYAAWLDQFELPV